MLSTNNTSDFTSSLTTVHPILASCSSQYNDSISVLSCVTSSLEASDSTLAVALDIVFVLYATSLVFLMQAGFAMLCAGSVRLKNVQNTMLKNLLDACGAAIGFWSFGYAFAYSSYNGDEEGTSFLGNQNFGLSNLDTSDWGFWLFQFAFAATCATIVAGTLAERCQMGAYLTYSLVLTGFVYPVVVRAVWSPYGFLHFANRDNLFKSKSTGMLDFAGSGVVHVTGGCTALLATWLLGPRKGRFHDSRGRKLEQPKPFPGHSAALQVLGTFILWFGWYGFNAGSIVTIAGRTTASGYPTAHIAALASINTTLSGSAGCISALFTRLYLNERRTGEATFDLSVALNGTISGLVAITGGCAYVEPWVSLVIGLVSGWVYLFASNLMTRRCLDDAVDAIPVHFANGMWGILAVGLFASEKHLYNMYGDAGTKHIGWFYEWGRGSGDGTLMMAQLVGLLFIIMWVLLMMSPFFLILNYVGLFRADGLEEVVGLDISYHGQNTYLEKREENINPEYMLAFRQKRNMSIEKRKNGSRHGYRSHGSIGSSGSGSRHSINLTTVVESGTMSGHTAVYEADVVHPVLNILTQSRQTRRSLIQPSSVAAAPSLPTSMNMSHHSTLSREDIVSDGGIPKVIGLIKATDNSAV